LANHKSKTIYGRYFWQTDFHGFLYWDQDDMHIVSNVFAGLGGKSNEALLLDTITGKKTSFYIGEYFCGPFTEGGRIRDVRK